ncbi:MAG: hypothetical protein RL065_420 [Bacteroidota bacterium]|jgi:hypothetical protein
MQFKAKINQLLEPQTGSGKNGVWKKQNIILETFGEYPKKICVTIWGDKVSNEILKLGNEVETFFDLESREFNGKWYTDVKVWKIELITNSSNEKSTEQNNISPADNPFIDLRNENDDDGLPF